MGSQIREIFILGNFFSAEYELIINWALGVVNVQ